MTHIGNRDDVIDLRSVWGRIDELEGDYPAPDGADENVLFAPVDEWDPDDRAEYDSLRALIAECESVIGDLRDITCLVRESYWVDHVKDWYEDTYGEPWIKSDRWGGAEFDHATGWHVRVTWSDIMATEPFSFIDWRAAADNLRRDRPGVEWEGITYIVG